MKKDIVITQRVSNKYIVKFKKQYRMEIYLIYLSNKYLRKKCSFTKCTINNFEFEFKY